MKNPEIFLVFAPEGPQAKQISRDLADVPNIAVEIVRTAQEASKRLTVGEVKCLVFITPQFDLNSVKFLSLLRETRKNLAVIVFASTVSKDIFTFSFTTKLKHVVVMEIPYKKEDLFAICEKIINGREVHQRHHGRFNLEQPCLINRLPTTDQWNGIIKNMSLSGAYVSVHGKFEETDTIKVDIALAAKQEETVYGEVVRVVPDAFGPGWAGIGIRFISQESLYRALLAKL